MGVKNVKIKTKEDASIILFVLCWIVYAIVSMTKTAFSSSIASIVEEGILTKSLAGMVSAVYYVFYGGAQLVLIKLVDKVSPFKLMNISILGAIISMIGFALADNFWVMLVLWGLTGLLQFAIWPAIIRISAQYILPCHRAKAMVSISFAYCGGMIANFFAASLILKLSGWRMIFWVFFVVMLITTLLWYVGVKKTTPYLEKEQEKVVKENKKSDVSFKKVLLTSGIMFLLVPSLVRTMLDLGLKSWVPTMITETYSSVSPSFANILTTVLMIVNLSGIYIVKKAQGWIKNDAMCLGLCFAISVPFMAMILLIGKIPVFAVVALLTIVTTFMYSGHQLINVIIPSCFAKVNMSGSIAAVLNSIASFGAVVANFGYGYLADNFGWTTTIMSWNIMAVIGALFAFLAVKQWGRFTKE